MDSEKIKLVYIGSSGRSGSTLLELILGAHPQLWTLGEFYVLPFAVESATKQCGCGMPVGECPFWGSIIEETIPILRGPSIRRFRDSYDAGRLFHFAEFPSIWSRNGSRSNRRIAELEQFAKDNARVMGAALAKSRQLKGPQVEFLVDASKSLYRLLWLKQSGAFDLRVIHLVKDPRAFAYSMSKQQDGSVNRRRAARAALRWNAENYLFDKLFRNRFAENEVLRIRYENLASNPKAVLQETLGWLELPYDESMVADFRCINHGIAGNPMRQRKTGIQLDEKWRNGLTPGMQRLVRGISSGLSKRYGFVR
jgi:hypothetical protein